MTPAKANEEEGGGSPAGGGRRPATGRSFATAMTVALLATAFATFLGMRSLFGHHTDPGAPSPAGPKPAGLR
jgi:hypothetical protein